MQVRCSVILVALFCALLGAASDVRWKLPDPATGQIGGQPAILFWPTSSESAELLDPTDCQVHAILKGTMRERQFPCGDWFVPPVGGYTGWVESEHWISPSTLIFSFGGGPFHGHGTRVLAPVVPAGRVLVHFKGRLATNDTVRMLSLDGAGHALERRVTLDAARDGVRMPARRAVAGIFREDDGAVALSRPFSVRAGDTTIVPLDVPSGASMLAVLSRPGTGKGRSTAAVKLFLKTPSGRRAPDFVLDTPARVFAAWYDLQPSQAMLEAESPEIGFDPVPLNLTIGKVTTVRMPMTFIRRPPKT